MSRTLSGDGGGSELDRSDLLREIADLGGPPPLPPPPRPDSASPPAERGSEPDGLSDLEAAIARDPGLAQREDRAAGGGAEREDTETASGSADSANAAGIGAREAARRRRATGRRQARLAGIRRRRRLRRLAVTVAVAVLGVAAATVLTVFVGGQVRDALAPAPEPADLAVGAEQDTLLLVRHPERGGPATGATLLAVGPGDSAAVVFIPVGTLMDLPGFGLDQLALAQQYGGPALVASTIENALGIRIDHVAALTDAGLAAFLDRSGGLEVEVREQIVERAEDGSATVLFRPGLQQLDGAQLAQLWSFRARGDDELTVFPRQQQILRRLLEQAGDDEVLEALAGDGAPMLGASADRDWIAEFFAGMARATELEQLSFSMLPVELFGGVGPAGLVSYRLDDAEAERLVNRLLAASIPEGALAGARRVQVLNGVGTPIAGQIVDAKLQGSGFRIILNDNADRFDYTDTLIIIYREDEVTLEAARRMQGLLGTGTIRVSRQPQSVVDLTIVVGSDLAPETGESVEPLETFEPREPEPEQTDDIEAEDVEPE